MKRQLVNQKRATAYHESGHAVMCWLNGVRLKSVTIDPDEDYVGFCRHEKIIRGRFPETDNSDRMRLKLERHVMISAAGPIAQKLYNPRSFRNYHASADYETVMTWALNANGSQKQAEAWLRWLEIRTKETLQVRWAIVKGLAEELLRANTLSGDKVQELFFALARGERNSWLDWRNLDKSRHDCWEGCANPDCLELVFGFPGHREGTGREYEKDEQAHI